MSYYLRRKCSLSSPDVLLLLSLIKLLACSTDKSIGKKCVPAGVSGLRSVIPCASFVLMDDQSEPLGKENTAHLLLLVSAVSCKGLNDS